MLFTFKFRHFKLQNVHFLLASAASAEGKIQQQQKKDILMALSLHIFFIFIFFSTTAAQIQYKHIKNKEKNNKWLFNVKVERLIIEELYRRRPCHHRRRCLLCYFEIENLQKGNDAIKCKIITSQQNI